MTHEDSCSSNLSCHSAEPPPDRSVALRIGGIDYLNALPLTEYLPREGSPPFIVSNHPPGILADMLREGLLDVALVPVVEYLARPDYRVLPHACIASYGAVESIRLYHRRPLDRVRRVGLDPRSRTSALLTRLFFRGLWGGGDPEYAPLPLDATDPRADGALDWMVAGGGLPARDDALGRGDPGLESLDAGLLIGDAALSLPPAPGWDMVDLGTEWTRWTGLPFVFAFWVCRAGLSTPSLVERFRSGKEAGLARIDTIVARARLPAGFGERAGRDYLSRVIQYDLGPDQEEGCLEFFARLRAFGLIPDAPRELRYL